MEQGTNLSRVGAFNRSVVLGAVRRAGAGISRAAISDRTGLTPQTVSNIVRRLLDEGLVSERGTSTGVRGAPGRLLVLGTRSRYAVGVHLDPAHLAVVVLDLAGGLRAERHLADVDLTDPAVAVPAMADAVAGVLDDAGVDRDRVLGVGVATPGPIALDGVHLGAPSQLGRWRGHPVVADLAGRTGLPVQLEKDAVAGALGEQWIHPGQSPADLVYLYLGHGVSAGLVVGGEVVRGATGNAGEFGGVLVRAHDTTMELWEACQPLQQLLRAERAGMPVDRYTADDPRSVRAAFARLCAVPAAAGMLADAGSALGAALARLVELLDAARVVVAGSTVSAAGEAMQSALRGALGARLTGLEARIAQVDPPPVVVSSLGERAVASGAACAVLRDALAPTATGLALPPRRGARPAAAALLGSP